MTTYVGIDLGTTNSAICSFDGESVRLYKSPEQTDVTPSAIFVDRRGNRFVGKRAYDNLARNPDNAAVLFKRVMGTSTPVKLPAAKITMTPEECSAEVLRTLFGYLPEDLRRDPDIGTVITVPAAFNQMQKDATIEAARAAGLGKVALMQEPVAAVMSVMRSRRGDGIFLVYDLGGGTLDIAIGQSIGGRVSLLGQGGIPMCGGRDFDRLIVDNVVAPWLRANFDLPEDLWSAPEYRSLRRMAEFAAEKAKVALSDRDEAVVAADEGEIATKDRAGDEIYIDVPVTRAQLDALSEENIRLSVEVARETIEKAGLTPHDIERVVFVGGPTQYKPLRDRVAFELGIAPSTDVNPMTAVAEGAAIFAESIDWGSQSRGRKTARGSVSAGAGFALTVNYVARTPDQKAKIGLKLGQPAQPGTAFQVDSLDTGWSSGRSALRDGAVIEVPLAKPGSNAFKIFVIDADGGPVALKEDRIVITRTAATVDAIPASHSVGVEARERVGGPLVLAYLAKAGDPLPARGTLEFKAEESLRAGAAGSLKFKVWEGDIEQPISDNRFIGMFEIHGSDFDDGVIAAGADLCMTYEITDGGNIDIEITVPSVGGSFHSGRNFYSRQSAMVDYSQAAKRIREEADHTAQQVSEIAAHVDGRALAEVRARVGRAAALPAGETDPETAKRAADDVQEAKRLLAVARKANLPVIRRLELDRRVAHFEHVRQHARPAEIQSFENLRAAAERLIGNPRQDFELKLQEMASKTFSIFVRQDWFIVDRFNLYVEEWSHLFPDQAAYEALLAEGRKAIEADDVDRLRQVVAQLDLTRIRSAEADDLIATANIIRN
ncbi:Hsp70 family protein [Methylobacterium sp. J-067]|uniref:Hsp70 family protein n=1 Tax=Methylobacterium sp. J-067 TaxID=2836648 RepID=UPI001FBA9311|nr:Hsp70 family protein [Methylobacterium sp. J-067]MCJ2026456.1 Hsp70 family protein [Methylobacterium sp. J-067]